MKVLEETNVGGKTFPLVYSLDQLWPKFTGAVTSNDLEVADTLTIRVHSIKLDSVPDVLPPKTEGTTYIGETRFPNNAGNKQTTYFSKLDRLPEKPEAEAIKEYKQQTEPHSTTVNRRRHKLEQASNHKWIWLSAILIVSIVTVIIGLIKRKQRH
jgi:hypothetical protein